MSWVLKDQEVRAVLSLGGPERYAYWIKKVADQNELWGLFGQEGWLLLGDDAGREMLPLWPHQHYATLCIAKDDNAYTPKSIELTAFLEKWVPGLQRDNKLIAIFPTPDLKSVPVEPRQLETDLREALSWYEANS